MWGAACGPSAPVLLTRRGGRLSVRVPRGSPGGLGLCVTPPSPLPCRSQEAGEAAGERAGPEAGLLQQALHQQPGRAARQV